VFSWVLSLALAAVVGFDNNIHGFWETTEKYDGTVFCWLQNGTSKVGYIPALLIYLPLSIAYVYSVYVICVAFLKLREGLPKTFNHRQKALVVNSANILVFSLYWLVLLVLYTSMFSLDPENKASQALYKLFIFGLSAKVIRLSSHYLDHAKC